MQSKVIEIDDNQIVYELNETTFTLSQSGDRLIKEPGYEIFLYHIDDLSFDTTDLIIMKVERNEKEYEEIIGIYTLEY